MAPFIYFQGNLGPGNLTIVEELSKLVPNIKIVDDNALVGPATAIFKPTEKGYQPLRRQLRRNILHSISESDPMSNNTWIFIDEHNSRETKAVLAADYEFIATMAHSPLISVILKCNFQKVSGRVSREDSKDYATYKGKLQELENKRKASERQVVFRLRNKYELELDVTRSTPTKVAEDIRDHLWKVKRMLAAREEFRNFGDWDHSRLN